MFSIREIAARLGATLLRERAGSPVCVVHDSRRVSPGDLFVALRGARTDGHRHLSEVFARGACGAVVAEVEDLPDRARNLIVVRDPSTALYDLAAAWRNRLTDARFVGITGTCGKTTTKGLIAHLLEDAGGIYAAPASFNTEIGLPLALLNMPEAARVGVFEIGASAPGEVAPLAVLIRPDVAVITMAGRGHLSGFGSVDAVAAEKWDLIRALSEDGRGFVNADCETLSPFLSGEDRPVTTFGMLRGSMRGRVVAMGRETTIEVATPALRLRTRLLGRHNATNVLAASAVGVYLGTTRETIERRMPTYAPPPHRLRLLPAPFGFVLDDSFNANPDSALAALETLAALDLPVGRRAFVFGDMFELGAAAAAAHREVLAHALRLGVAPVFTTGLLATEAGAQFPEIAVTLGADPATEIRSGLGEDQSLLLVKGSRRLGLDRLVDALTRSGNTS